MYRRVVTFPVPEFFYRTQHWDCRTGRKSEQESTYIQKGRVTCIDRKYCLFLVNMLRVSEDDDYDDEAAHVMGTISCR